MNSKLIGLVYLLIDYGHSAAADCVDSCVFVSVVFGKKSGHCVIIASENCYYFFLCCVIILLSFNGDISTVIVVS